MNDNIFFKNILTDLKVSLHSEFDRNFERKAFFTQKWPVSKIKNHRGSQLIRTGKLRRSLKSKVVGGSIVFSSSMAYADIQNNGGKIKVTAKMKRYFWAMHYKDSKGAKGKNKGNAQAQMWKALALKKVGDTIEIPKRQFIGHHPIVDKAVKKVVDKNVNEINQYIKNKFKK